MSKFLVSFKVLMYISDFKTRMISKETFPPYKILLMIRLELKYTIRSKHIMERIKKGCLKYAMFPVFFSGPRIGKIKKYLLYFSWCKNITYLLTKLFYKNDIFPSRSITLTNCSHQSLVFYFHTNDIFIWMSLNITRQKISHPSSYLKCYW